MIRTQRHGKLDGQQPDARDDVYSLACLSYVLLSGKHPFGEKTALGAQEQRLRPSRPDGLIWKEWSRGCASR